MPRNIPVGNGNMLVAFDENYHMRELYYPYVGEENHTNGNSSMMGVWIDGTFHWVDKKWSVDMKYLPESLVTDVSLSREGVPIELKINECVDFHENVLIKRIGVRNTSSVNHDIRIFLTLDLDILGNEIGDTAMYRPDKRVIVHYKRDRWFLVNMVYEGQHGIERFAIGSKGKNGLEGTYMDAVDGVLECNPIEQGSVDSVTGIELDIEGGGEREFFYYICVGKSWEEVYTLDSIIRDKTPQELLKRTENYWKLWSTKEDLPLNKLPERLAWLYNKSLLILRTQIDNHGGIIAANDSDVMQYNRDTYSYIWPRDGSLVAHALDRAGYLVLSSRFYDFAGRVICVRGFLAHKYTPSEDVGSSWHPWVNKGKRQFPIQEDETALTVWALCEHFKRYRDIEFIKPLYKKIVKNGAEFMCRFTDKFTGLPLESYDLWEERLGVHAFTVASVYGGLIGASDLASSFGEIEQSERYREAAERMKEAFIEHMYLEEGYFARMVRVEEGKVTYIDRNVDASLYSVFAFGMFEASHPMVRSSMERVERALWVDTSIGGVARYIDDPYYRTSPDIPGNPWIITTLWLAIYYIEIGDQGRALELLHWVGERALPSGVLSEQVNPYTGAPLSVSPLTWSHATYIEALQRYMDRFL